MERWTRSKAPISDQKGNIWMASFANDSVHVFPKGDPLRGYPAHTVPLSTPFHIQIDDKGFGWVSYEGLSRLASSRSRRTDWCAEFTVALGPETAEGDRSRLTGNAWVAAGAADAVYAVDKKGTCWVHSAAAASSGRGAWPWTPTTTCGLKISAPRSSSTPSIACLRLCGAKGRLSPGRKLGDPISPAAGYTLPSGATRCCCMTASRSTSRTPRSVVQAADAGHRGAYRHGRQCVDHQQLEAPEPQRRIAAIPGGDGIVIFVGLAAPVKPTYTGQPVAP